MVISLGNCLGGHVGPLLFPYVSPWVPRLGRLISFFLDSAKRIGIAFLLALAVLMCGPWLRAGWHEVRSVDAELPLLRGATERVFAQQATMVGTVKREADQMATATLEALDARIRTVDKRTAGLLAARAAASSWPDVRGGTSAISQQLVEAAKRDIELELRQQERIYLVRLRASFTVLRGRKVAERQLEHLRLAYLANVTSYNNSLIAQAHVRDSRTRTDNVVHFLAIRGHDRDFDVQIKRMRAQMDASLVAFRVQRDMLAQLPTAPTLTQLRVDEKRLEAATAPLRERLAKVSQMATHNLAWRAYHAARSVAGPAALVVIGWLCVPIAIRALFYFVLAPLASRTSPVVIDKRASAGVSEGAYRRQSDLASGVSMRLALAPGQEMLIRPEYCQSLPEAVMVRTKILFDWSYLLPSVASHMWMLNRMRVKDITDIVLSSTIDPLEEVALLDIPAGTAFVMQSRGLVGVLYDEGKRTRIHSHWRLGTVHAWLTLQLRYLSFEGPATLVVKGCRGVRLERASAGRTVSQDATLGFSANAVYSTVRGKPFLPYALGRQALLHDRFEGTEAYYLYEEIPRNANPGYRKSNPLEVLVDAGLKALGI
jgi:hypothetical protein